MTMGMTTTMDGYWVGYTEARDKKYACIFNKKEDVMKYIESLTSSNLRVKDLSDFIYELKRNFNLKYFEFKENAQNFRDDFLS